jgi:hypothetical protein
VPAAVAEIGDARFRDQPLNLLRWQNGYIESFNGKVRDECLNENWFLELTDARRKIAEWKWEGSSGKESRAAASGTGPGGPSNGLTKAYLDCLRERDR